MALHFKLRVLLWLVKKINLQKISPEQFRRYNNQTTAKVRKIIDFAPEKMFQITDRFVKTPEHDIPVRLYHPTDTPKLPILLFFHGGGFVIGNIETYDSVCRRLAKLTNCIVVSVEYRLAPEHKFPAAPNDCFAATCWAAEKAEEFGGDASRIAVCGDSAGGNLATVVAMMARDKGFPQLAYQVLVYPCTDGRMEHPSIKELAEGYILTEEMMRWFIKHYARNQEDIAHPHFSPLLATNVSNLPPTLIITAGFDPLKDEGKLYAEKLRQSGVKVLWQHYPDMIHTFFQMPKYLKKARHCHALIASELKTAFGTEGLI